jgi:hypothetical protein
MTHHGYSHQERPVDVAPLPSRSPHRRKPRRGLGTIISFALFLTLILSVILSAMGIPTPLNLLPAQTSEQC